MHETSENILIVPSKISLSIVTVVRNDEKRLSETIKSLRNFYNMQAFEHIIVDGLSSDNTVNLLEGVRGYKNVQILSGPDIGIYDAMNKGISLASGQFILFLNCGDKMLAVPSQLELWLSKLAKVDIACFPCNLSYADRETLLLPRGYTKYKMPTSHQAMIFSKDFIAENIYESCYKIAGDFDLYLRAKQKKIYMFQGNDPLTSIEGEGYASATPTLAYKEYLHIVFIRYCGFLRVIAIVQIAYKGLIAITLKKIIPKKWIGFLRNKW